MSRLIERYDDSTRMNHWVVAVFFVLAGLSGLAFFHPSLFFFSNLFGGGPWTRILHPFLGVVMFLAFVGMFVRQWRANLPTEGDKAWASHMRDLLKGNKAAMPPAGKYNAGQKRVFWIAVICLAVMLVTGVMMWRPWFAPAFAVPLLRVAVLLHAVAAFVLVLSTIVHVYAAIWIKGSVRAMTRGTVTENWARTYHKLWYDEVTRGR